MFNKTKKLSVAEYFVIIQKEYLIADFKRKIYYNPNDKAYYQKVMNYKVEKINNISSRNHLDSILTNAEKMEEIRKELFDDSGFPNFEMNEYDLENYYSIGNYFSFNGEIWTLKSVNDDGTLTIYSEKANKYETVEKNKVCRIL